jgi:hypothetical protein
MPGPAHKLAISASAALVITVLTSLCFADTKAPNPSEIIKKSVAVNDADWKQQPNYTHQERDVNAKVGPNGKITSKEEKTYRVHMIEGSPYNELIAENGEPLDSERRKQEETKLKAEIRKRSNESKSARASRIDKYKKERAEEHLLLQQMTEAFKFKLSGEEKIDGHECYVLDATPNPDYQPAVTKARVLTGMKGRLWIEKDTYHWVRVHAQVVKPVEFGLFIAKVRPGTEFELDQSPVDGSVWLPSHFSQSVDARVLGFYGIRSHEDEYYSDYQRGASNAKAQAVGRATR